MICNLGKVLTILTTANVVEHSLHADVDAFNAPSECHSLVNKGAAKRSRTARRHAEAVAQRPLRVIINEARHRGGFFIGAGRQYDRAFDRLYARHGFPG